MSTPVKQGMGVSFFLWNLVREDLVFCNSPHINRFSVRKQEGYRSFSEFSAQHNAGYAIDVKTQRFYPLEGTKTVNLDEVFAILKSKDEALLNTWMFDGQRRFLDGKPILS